MNSNDYIMPLKTLKSGIMLSSNLSTNEINKWIYIFIIHCYCIFWIIVKYEKILMSNQSDYYLWILVSKIINRGQHNDIY